MNLRTFIEAEFVIKKKIETFDNYVVLCLFRDYLHHDVIMKLCEYSDFAGIEIREDNLCIRILT